MGTRALLTIEASLPAGRNWTVDASIQTTRGWRALSGTDHSLSGEGLVTASTEIEAVAPGYWVVGVNYTAPMSLGEEYAGLFLCVNGVIEPSPATRTAQ